MAKVRIVDADWVADNLRLNVSFEFGGELEPELWEVECGGVVEERLSSDGAQGAMPACARDVLVMA